MPARRKPRHVAADGLERRPIAVFALFAIGLALGLAVAAVPAAAQELRLDPAKVEGPDACGECHKDSVAAWKETHHATTFRTLPRKDKAREIADKLGLKRIKAESTCLSCHFTSALRDGKATPIAGITCESCHAAGKDWIKLHSDYGGKDATKETETPEHAKERYARSEAAGMIRPVRLYDVATNCYGCHTVPMENLVNVGGHPAGSKFELVQWSQGEVRHNVWYSKENGEASVARKRLMYVLGKALDLEFALRGVAIATKKAAYAVSMAKRAKRAENALKKIAGVVDSPEIGAILEAAAGVKLKLNNEAPLTAAADEVAAAARAFAEAHDGSAFAALDPLLPEPGDYRGKVFR